MASKDTGTVYALVGALAGAAIGAALGLVYSPSTGEKNRQALLDWGQERAEDLQRKALSELHAVQQKAEDRIAQVRQEAEQRVEALRHTAEERLDTARHKVEETAGSLTGSASAEAAEASRTANRISEWVEGNVESTSPETPDSSTGLGPSNAPPL